MLGPQSGYLTRARTREEIPCRNARSTTTLASRESGARLQACPPQPEHPAATRRTSTVRARCTSCRTTPSRPRSKRYSDSETASTETQQSRGSKARGQIRGSRADRPARPRLSPLPRPLGHHGQRGGPAQGGSGAEVPGHWLAARAGGPRDAAVPRRSVLGAAGAGPCALVAVPIRCGHRDRVRSGRSRACACRRLARSLWGGGAGSQCDGGHGRGHAHARGTLGLPSALPVVRIQHQNGSTSLQPTPAQATRMWPRTHPGRIAHRQQETRYDD